MYQIRCDDYILYDPRDEDLTLKSPKCKLVVNTVGEASFTILSKHPYFDRLSKLKSIFEIRQDDDVIFRGRMTDDSKDFDNKKQVDLEGAMAYFNDSMVRPFTFPDDFLDELEYQKAADEPAVDYAVDGGVVRYFLKMVIDNHNAQVEPFQQFKLGRVTVYDPNNYLSRSESDYKKSWEILKEKLFESSLGGYLCIRYEADGNYIDYLADFDSDNSQKIVFGENLLDLSIESDATETYSAIIPLGAEIEGTEKRLSIEGFPDYDEIIEDIGIKGEIGALYSKSAVEKFGWICAPVEDTTWETTNGHDLIANGAEFLKNKASKFLESVTVKAIDLHLSNKEIEAFRIYRNVYVESTPHNQSGKNKLSELDIDIENPQNTTITVGETKRVLTDKTNKTVQQVSEVKKTAYQTNLDLSNKVSKTDDAQIITMLNRANETASNTVAKFLGNRLVIESSNFILSDEGNVTIKSQNNSYKVDIGDGRIHIEGETYGRGETFYFRILTLKNPLLGDKIHSLWLVLLGTWDEETQQMGYIVDGWRLIEGEDMSFNTAD